MHTLEVDLGHRSYPIHIAPNLLTRADLLAPHLPTRQVMLVSNTLVAPLYLAQLQETLTSLGHQVETCILPDGEAYKTLDSVNQIFDALLKQRFNRTCTLVALGGGVIGDMVGFAAACYQRGVNFIQIPTTLLSQVDSSVGGKTGVNHPLGKNMIGAFWQPQLVLADTQVLSSLPARELSAGLAEIIKYALLGDADFIDWLEAHLPELCAYHSERLGEAVLKSCQAKAQIVAADEREQGVRALLNLGHTFGHAIETHMGYGQWLHGEAVAVGMYLAARMSCALGWLTQAQVARVQALLQAAKLPYLPPASMQAQDFLTHMAVDKKVLDGRLRLILLQDLGQAVITQDFPISVLHDTLNQVHLEAQQQACM